jgi:sialate O-acetylesterase
MISFYKVFSNHAVVQRERPIVFSGYNAVPNSVIKGTFAGTEVSSMSQADGTWSVTFPAMAAGGPYDLTVTSGDETIGLTDLLVGEVWLCSGQSNMEMPMNSNDPFWRVKNADAECAAANFPQIRLFDYTNLKRMAPAAPMDDAHAGEWTVCTPDSVYNFSACAYFFGRKLHQDLNVPIGLISTSWGGTNIQAWISQRMFERNHWMDDSVYNHEHLDKENAEQLRKTWLEGAKPLMAWVEKFNKLGEAPKAWLQEKLDDCTGWQKCNNSALTCTTVLPVPGRYVVRFEIELPEVLADSEYLFKNMTVNDCDRTFVNGIEVGCTTPESPMYWSMARNYVIPAGVLHAGRNTIAIIADDHLTSGDVNLSNAIIYDRAGKKEGVKPLNDTLMKRTVFTCPDDIEPRPAPPENLNIDWDCPNYPSSLYNGMLYCWRRYAIRGVIWYQGCNNNGCHSYYQLHKMLIEDMRELWNDKDLPFYLVQLAAFHQYTPDKPMTEEQVAQLETHPQVFSAYGLTREIQTAVRNDMHNVGMACIFDCGEHSDIHPRNKQDVGARLALLAERNLYKFDVKAEGPQFAGWRREGNVVRLFFKYAHGLHTTDGKAPRAFFCMNRTGVLYPADAKIDGETIIVFCQGVAEPEAIRYAFTGYCRVNLVNDAGLPAEPFRTDAIDYRHVFC